MTHLKQPCNITFISVVFFLLKALILLSILKKKCRQVEGKDGITKLMSKFKTTGPSVFFHGSLAAAAATFVGHYPVCLYIFLYILN